MEATAVEMPPLPDSKMLVTMWWWMPNPRIRPGKTVILRWTDANGGQISNPTRFQIIFFPTTGERWSYVVPVPEEAAILQVSIRTWN